MPDPTTHEDKSDFFSYAEKSLRAVVSGRVQGVGFRFFVVREGRRLGLTGVVANLPDGRVEVQARGDRDSLGQLVERLRRGPVFSRVDRVDVEWGVPIPEVQDFIIGY